MRVLITGADGQLARELVTTAPSGVVLRAVDRDECDITKSQIVDNVLESFRPDIVINTAAYTAVDAAEDNKELAFRVNAQGAGHVAKSAALVGSRLIHISTDYVFDGERSSPYPVTAEPRPLNIYGSSKLAGEIAVRKSGAQATVIRCGWLFAATGNSFLLRVLRRIQEGRSLRVVNDQLGAPSSCTDLAAFIWWCAHSDACGEIMHWTNAGVSTWYEFAVAVLALALERSLIRTPVSITPISSSEYQSVAPRPKYSVLDARESWGASGRDPDHWRVAAAKTLDRYIAST